VSGHGNHRDVSLGVQMALAPLPLPATAKAAKDTMPPLPEHLQQRVFALVSQPTTVLGTLSKYLGPLHYAMAHIAQGDTLGHCPSSSSGSGIDIGGDGGDGGAAIVLLNPQPSRTWHAMALHDSQWRPLRWYWYRRLHVLLSRYTFVNEFVPL
jgi:hypothetical protein